MISLIFFILAAICNATMDITQFHYHNSMFNNALFNREWWNGEESWKNKYLNHDPKNGRKTIMGSHINFPVQLTDAFHFFKTLMIIFLCISIVSFDYKWVFEKLVWYTYIIIIGVYGTLWNCTFSLFYNKILGK